MLFPEGIKRAKGQEVKVDKRVVLLIESTTARLSLNGEG